MGRKFWPVGWFTDRNGDIYDDFGDYQGHESQYDSLGRLTPQGVEDLGPCDPVDEDDESTVEADRLLALNMAFDDVFRPRDGEFSDELLFQVLQVFPELAKSKGRIGRG